MAWIRPTEKAPERTNLRAISSECSLCEHAFSRYIESPFAGTKSRVEEERRLFVLWTKRFAVYSIGPSSLDSLLEDQPKDREVLLQILRRIQKSLNRAVVEPVDPGGNISIKRRNSQGSNSVQSSQDSYETMISLAVSQAMSHATQAKVSLGCLQAVKQNLKRLHTFPLPLQLSLRPDHEEAPSGPVGLNQGGHGMEESAEQQFERFAGYIVNHRYPEIPTYLRERLQISMNLRRSRLLYWQEHARMIRNLKPVRSLRPKDESDKAIEKDTISHNQSPISVHAHKGGRVDLASETIASTFFSEIRIETNTVREGSVNVVTSPGTLDFPPPPSLLPGCDSFECPYCGLICPSSDVKFTRWRKHVTRDLEPYICVDASCITPQETFGSYKSWVQHMQQHNSEWQCAAPIHGPRTFPDVDEFKKHLLDEHWSTVAPSHIPIMTRNMARPCAPKFTHCPLCVVGMEEATHPKRMLRHIGMHLVSLALLCLPWQDGGEESIEDTDAAVGSGTLSDNWDEDFEYNYEEVSRDISFTTTEDDVPNLSVAINWDFIQPMVTSLASEQDPILASMMRR